MPTDDDIVQRAIARFGPVLDLRERPQDLVDIVRAARVDELVSPDGGAPPGGTPPPPPPPGPTSGQVTDVRLEEVMDELLRLRRQVAEAAGDVASLRGHFGL
ncbi:hypothetical protein GTQ99_05765 [Kineococcus sp. T13]|uniref:hypothetical protein n=1 Tax=Kineococcus vitellinus TaxID=2696565 RepID=UPI00141325C6|nr:hypothetical protein [Kineococcus vitellinus]NAZ74931.1 hypothetical protein [Kineococcus vitellinus]